MQNHVACLRLRERRYDLLLSCNVVISSNALNAQKTIIQRLLATTSAATAMTSRPTLRTVHSCGHANC